MVSPLPFTCPYFGRACERGRRGLEFILHPSLLSPTAPAAALNMPIPLFSPARPPGPPFVFLEPAMPAQFNNATTPTGLPMLQPPVTGSFISWVSARSPAGALSTATQESIAVLRVWEAAAFIACRAQRMFSAPASRFGRLA